MTVFALPNLVNYGGDVLIAAFMPLTDNVAEIAVHAPLYMSLGGKGQVIFGRNWGERPRDNYYRTKPDDGITHSFPSVEEGELEETLYQPEMSLREVPELNILIAEFLTPNLNR